MTKEFEELETVDEMIGFLAGDEDGEEDMFDAPETTEDVRFELQNLNVQIFVKLLPRFLALPEHERKQFEEAVQMFTDPRIDTLVRYSALALINDALFPDDAAVVKQITRKEEKVYNIPCEDCESSPTHMIVFKEGERTEQHYLCEECEKNARTE